MPWVKVEDYKDKLQDSTEYMISDGVRLFRLWWNESYPSFMTFDYIPNRIVFDTIAFVYVYSPMDVVKDNPELCRHEWEDTDVKACVKCGYWETA